MPTPSPTPVLPSEIPQTAFLRKYGKDAGYADCYVTEVAGVVSQAAFVEAFYTTGLFKVERLMLKWFAGRPSTDVDARQLAAGAVASFAVWRVEAQSTEQLLLADFTDSMRSWLMAEARKTTATAGSTRLYFGSAVVRGQGRSPGTRKIGFASGTFQAPDEQAGPHPPHHAHIPAPASWRASSSAPWPRVRRRMSSAPKACSRCSSPHAAG